MLKLTKKVSPKYLDFCKISKTPRKNIRLEKILTDRARVISLKRRWAQSALKA